MAQTGRRMPADQGRATGATLFPFSLYEKGRGWHTSAALLPG